MLKNKFNANVFNGNLANITGNVECDNLDADEEINANVFNGNVANITGNVECGNLDAQNKVNANVICANLAYITGNVECDNLDADEQVIANIFCGNLVLKKYSQDLEPIQLNLLMAPCVNVTLSQILEGTLIFSGNSLTIPNEVEGQNTYLVDDTLGFYTGNLMAPTGLPLPNNDNLSSIVPLSFPDFNTISTILPVSASLDISIVNCSTRSLKINTTSNTNVCGVALIYDGTSATYRVYRPSTGSLYHIIRAA